MKTTKATKKKKAPARKLAKKAKKAKATKTTKKAAKPVKAKTKVKAKAKTTTKAKVRTTAKPKPQKRPAAKAKKTLRPIETIKVVKIAKQVRPPDLITLPEALEIAIDFEHKVRDHYANGAKIIVDTQGAKVFASLAKEEQSHVDYLKSRMDEWTRTGKVEVQKLDTILPTAEWVKQAEKRHQDTLTRRKVADQNEVELLKTALRLEEEASTFYHDLVRRLPEGERDLFEQFLNIEDGHLAIVQAELDSVQGLGYWFDVQEFALEAQ